MAVKRLFRLTRQLYADDLSGRGARINGGRWNHEGTPILYAVNDEPLAILEVLAGITIEDCKLYKWAMVVLEVSKGVKVKTLQSGELPEDWCSKPPSDSTRNFGTEWVRQRRECILMVPSSVLNSPDSNSQIALINPLHPQASLVTISLIKPFTFDNRLFKEK